MCARAQRRRRVRNRTRAGAQGACCIVEGSSAIAENDTVPVGVIFVPEFVSVTVAVQVVALFSESGFGAQATTVEVGLIATVRVCKLLVAAT